MARILIVDDEAAIRQSVSLALRRRGHEPVEAANTSEATSLAQRDLPDLIISDLCMEGGDGLSFLKAIRSDPRTGTIPFVIITGQPDWDGMTEGVRNAADGYLLKPFPLETLLQTVQHRLDRERILRSDADEIKSQLYQVLQGSPDLIGMLDPEALCLFFLNGAGQKMLESGDEFPLSLPSFYLPADARNLRDLIIPAVIKEGQWMGEGVLVSRSGRKLAVKQTFQAHRRHDGKIEYLSVIAHDLTDSNESERALRSSEYRFRCLVDALPDAVIMYDDQGRITFCNARTSELLGYSVRDLLSLSVRDIFGGTPPVESKGHTSHLRKDFTNRENFVFGKTGNRIPVSVFTGELEIEEEQIHLCIVHDLTERKEFEQERQSIEVQLRQAQKLESIGQLAAGVAHEINTPTQYIGDNIRFLKDAFAGLLELQPIYEQLTGAARQDPAMTDLLPQVERVIEKIDLPYLMREIPIAIEQSLEGTERVTKIVRAMKDFSHPNVTEKTLFDINSAIESTLTVARNEWKYVANLETNLDPNLPLVPCLPGELNQVILNLLVNAAHAIKDAIGDSPNKGVITIATIPRGGSVEIRIADTGTGIPEAVRGKIFEPFFTTKEVGKGTGQGLAMARSVIVEKHGGSIGFETELGKGATFIIRLPLNPNADDRES